MGDRLRPNALKSLCEKDLLQAFGGSKFSTILADPPWRFKNRTGKIAPEYAKSRRYVTMSLTEICELPVGSVCADNAHLYLWASNAILPEALFVMNAWGFEYKSNIIWHKIGNDGNSDRRGVGFYFRNVTEILLFGLRGRGMRTLAPGRRTTNLIAARRSEHSRKPEAQYDLIGSCSPGPYLELFARGRRHGWAAWGLEAGTERLTQPRKAPKLRCDETSRMCGEKA